MAKEGWNLTVVGFCHYIFRRGTPGEYIYKLDVAELAALDEVNASYFNFLTECGIRIVGDLNDWLYLQKKTADGLFNMKDDTHAKLRKVNKVYSFAVRTLCRLLAIFAIIVAICLVGMGFSSVDAMHDFFEGVVFGVSTSALIILALIWVNIINKLRRKVNHLIEDVGVTV